MFWPPLNQSFLIAKPLLVFKKIIQKCIKIVFLKYKNPKFSQKAQILPVILFLTPTHHGLWCMPVCPGSFLMGLESVRPKSNPQPFRVGANQQSDSSRPNSFWMGLNPRPAGVSSRTRSAWGGGVILPLLLLSHEPRVAEGPARRRSKYLTEKILMSA